MVSKKPSLRFWITLCCLTAITTACGGGGGGGSTPTSTPSATATPTPTSTPTATPTPTPDDETPASFAFTSATDAALGGAVESNTVTIDDINVAVAVTIADGEYSINDGAFSSTAGVINEGDTLTLRGTAASEFSSDVVVGVTVGTVTETFTITTVAKDTTPEPFAFTARTEVPLEALLESEEAITVSGINDDAPISITGGEYAIGEGDFTSEDGAVSNGESVKVRLTSSSSFSTATTATLTIGGVVGDFTVTTLAADTTPEAFSFTSVADVALSATAESEAVTISGINTTTPVSIQNGEYKIDDGSYTSDAGTIENGQSIQVRTTASGTFSTAVVATLNVGGVEATFTATTVAQDITPEDFGFAAVTQAPLDALIGSSTASITGITGAVPISVQNGWYRIDSGAATTEVGTITNGQSVIVSGESSAEFETETVVTLTVGNVIRTFNITTAARDIVPDDFSFSAETGADLDTQYESEVKTISGINDTATISVTNGEYRIDGGAYTSADGTIENGQEVQVRTTSSSAADTEVQAMLTVGGLARVYSVTTMADEEAPTASIVFPPPVSMTEGTTIVIRGTAEDALSSIARVTIKGGTANVEAASDDDFATWKGEITLNTAAENTITIETEDSLGNIETTAAKVMVKQDATLADFPSSANSFTRPVALVVDHARNRALISDRDLDTIFAMDLDTGERTLFSDSSFADATHPYEQPEGFLIDGDVMWVGDRTSDKLLSVDLLTGEKTAIATDDFPADGIIFQSPRELIFDPSNSDNLIIADESEGVTIVNKTTGVRSVFYNNLDSYSRGVAYDAQRDRIIILDRTYNLINAGLKVFTDATNASYLSTNTTHPSDVNFTTDLVSIQIDRKRDTAFVADPGIPGVIAVDLATGARKLLLETENAGNDNMFVEPNEVFYDAENDWLLVIDAGLNALLAVDAETGERVYYTNCTDDQNQHSVVSYCQLLILTKF